MRKIIFTIAIALLVSVGVVSYSVAQEEKEVKGPKPVKKRILSKSVQGEVAGIGIDFISITYAINAEKTMEKEILLPFDAGVEIKNRKSVKEIQAGDIVAINYEEVTEDSEASSVSRLKAKTITFIKAMPKSDASQSLDTDTQSDSWETDESDEVTDGEEVLQ